MTKKNRTRKNLISAFNEMEAAGKLPLFAVAHDEGPEIPEMEINSALDLDPADMGMLRVVDAALTINNVVKMLNVAKESVKEAFPNETSIHDPITLHLETAITEMLAAQANVMTQVTKAAKTYNKATKARKPKTQEYEKTYSRTKAVR